jgi:hypothetical protein
MGDEFDAIIGTVSPSVPVKLPASVTVPTEAGGDLAMGGAFEGASRFDSQMAFWAPTLRSADADMIPDKPLADARARDMLRNDAYIQGGANLHKDNIVGAHFLLNANLRHRALFGKQDDVWEGSSRPRSRNFSNCSSNRPIIGSTPRG